MRKNPTIIYLIFGSKFKHVVSFQAVLLVFKLKGDCNDEAPKGNGRKYGFTHSPLVNFPVPEHVGQVILRNFESNSS